MPFGHYRKRMVVMLYPGDKIAMRLEKSRTWYWAELDDVFRVLAQWHANRECQRRRENAKRGAAVKSRWCRSPDACASSRFRQPTFFPSVAS